MENKSGWFPLLHKIIILPEETEMEKLEKKTGFIIPGLEGEREAQVQVRGTVIAVGPEVFSDQPHSIVPMPGDVVMFSKLSGYFFDGEDGIKYRMIQDLDLAAVKGRK